MPTPHNEATRDQIAPTVLMPGDPLRAKFIAENFLINPVLVNQIRNNLTFTGTYKDKRITVMSSGMGMPSIGIYSYELFSMYGVENIIRVGSAGAYSADLNVYDVILAKDAYSVSTFAEFQSGFEGDVLPASQQLNDVLIAAAKDLNLPVKIGRVHSTDVFYRQADKDSEPAWQRMKEEHNCDCVEMESFALFNIAKILGKKAACILTVSDSFVKDQDTTAEERQSSFTDMMKVALEAGIKL
ncbi:MAG: purine-nucleoside phosphorylase [Bifidobacteriaceae bacterium]|jgi:purine-nucleoside phosphorylase|nr:purine-nucleoside phosphorylase [Bifidobacteriaceae bacterium]